MKAAVIHQLGSIPRCEDFPDPVPAEDQMLVSVKAAAIMNLDKWKAAGLHYTDYGLLPVVVGFDGVGTLGDGTRIWAMGTTGMMAEKALVTKGRYVKLPDGLDDDTAAVLPNALMGSAMAYRFRSGIKPGATVLVLGATGITGMVAVQLARHYGAWHVIATGRNAESLEALKSMGADEVVSLDQDDAGIIQQFKKIQTDTPIDLVMDYLWGRPMELLLEALSATLVPGCRICTIGDMAGKKISMPSGILRSRSIEIMGSGIGSITPTDYAGFMKNEMPVMMNLAASGMLKVDPIPVTLAEVEESWQRKVPSGSRLVVRM